MRRIISSTISSRVMFRFPCVSMDVQQRILDEHWTSSKETEELMAAGRSLLTTRPTTLLGTIAVLRYVGSQEDEDEVEVGHYHGRAGLVGLVLAQSLTRLSA